MTKKGEEYLAHALKANSVIHIFSVFSPKEIDHFCSLLSIIENRASQYINPNHK